MPPIIEAAVRDLRQAARGLVRTPGFTIVAVTTLALAIGANTAIFSVVDAVLLRPLPFPEPDRLVSIRGTAPGSDLPDEFGVGPEFFLEYRANAPAIEDLGTYNVGQSTARDGENVDRLFMGIVSPSFFTTLGVTPAIGRLPTPEDGEEVAVLSDWLWEDWYGRDPSVIGRSFEMAGEVRTVLGVMGPDFRFPDERVALWISDVLPERVAAGNFGLNLVGRITAGTDHDALAGQLGPIAQRLPDIYGGSASYADIIQRHRPVVRSLEAELVGDVATPLWILLGTVGIVLLIACSNVANLLIVRAEGRRRDLAVWRALGAGRSRLIGAQLSEALLVAALGAAGGVLLAWIGVPLLVRAAPEGIPRLGAVGIDPTALLFTAGVAVIAALVSGLLPAIRSSSPALLGALRESTRVGSGPNQITRNVLVIVQTAAALVLLVGSGLLVQSFRELTRVDPGFDTEDIFTFQMAPDPASHGLEDGPALARFHYEFMDRLAAIPGVESVGLVNTLPLDEGAGANRFETERSAQEGAVPPMLRMTFADGDYFGTMGIELLAGRFFERNTEPRSDIGVIVGRTTADQLWPGDDPLGQRLRPVGAPEEIGWLTVIGVVEDVMLADFRQEAPDPMIYVPMVGPTPGAWGVGTPAYVVKTPRAETIAPEIREVVRDVAPDAPMYRVFTMAGLAARANAQLTFTMLTLAVAAGLALVLGAIGLYGVLSYVVAQRTREIGIRMAIGQQAAGVRRMVVTQGGRIALVGVVIGVVAALWLTQVLESLLFGVRALDPVIFVAMSGLMVVVALLASYLPARRASAVSPMVALRGE